jgi:hypothetical protein
MNIATFIAVAVTALIIFLSARHIYREKKKGTACIGCPYSGSCGKKKADSDCRSDVTGGPAE